jgi:UDP-3-O-[3-hydroxymyristoyl] N-acetylglucosamine deacetylase
MDGLTDLSFADHALGPEQTLARPIGCVGIALHSGRRVRMELAPAPAGTGIVFHRTDLGVDIPARFDRVVASRLCTVLALPGEPEARVGTVEHLMAALAGNGIDNARISVSGPELPILDGSAEPFGFLIDCAGRASQGVPRRVIEVLHPVRVEDGDGFAELRPTAGAGLTLSVSIAFEAAAIGRQALTLTLGRRSFRRTLAAARTFAVAHEIEALRAAGLALGGSLDNAVVVDGDRVLNPAGLRSPQEFVRHKALDLVGDLALAGAPLRASVVAHRPGHALNNRLLRALFADASAYRVVESMPESIAAAA